MELSLASPSATTGELRLPHRHGERRTVRVLNRLQNGDSLVHDGTQVLMVPGHCCVVEGERKTAPALNPPPSVDPADRLRLDLVTRMFAFVQRSDFQGAFVVYREMVMRGL